MERTNYILTLIFSGAATILGLLILVFLLVLAFDKISFFNSTTDMLTPDELEERRTASDMTRRAGLAGMLSSERIRVYRAFFEKQALPYLKTEDDDQKEDDAEAQNARLSNEKLSSEDDTEDDKSNVESADERENESQEEENKKFDRTCPICLNEYDEGDKVITGTSCSHMFHYDCCMQWLEKGNEHCPYCRKGMMTFDELFEAARVELGEARVDKLKRINGEAARRLAEYEAARQQDQEATLTVDASDSNNVTVDEGESNNV